ncbi:hypothetical protein BDV59DRAFT_100581 [Aspergillus ambiguus]|uniref:putative Chromo domain protein Chp1p n=1 Tax=Aspergillus ambiguus TaxID=176160 RepID=UPI003CCD10F9
MAQADDDDSISVTSTVLSEEQSEYEVEGILDEFDFDGETKYLVKWLGYPLERCTWEPAESFSTDETLRDWETKKTAIAEGKLPPFDRDAWEDRIIALDEEREERKHQRRAKRRRLGLLDVGSKGPKQPTDAPARPEASKVNTSSTEVYPEARPSTGRPLPGSLSHVPQRRELVPIAPRPPALQPPILFGSGRPLPAPGPARAKRPHNSDSFKRFNLSTQRRYQKAKTNDGAPNASQVELFRPSDFPARTGANMINLGSRSDQRKPDGARAEGTSKATTIDTAARPARQPIDTIPSDKHTTQPLTSGRPPALNPPGHESIAHREAPQKDTSELPPKFLPRRPGPKAKRAGQDLWWNPGEVLIHVYYGPDRQEIGPARLCGLRWPFQEQLIRPRRSTPQLNIWFQHLSNLADYQIQFDNVRSGVLCNGWVEGFDNSEPKIYKFAQELKQKNLVAIFPPTNEHQDVYIAYPTYTRDFGFLGHSNMEPQDVFLRVAVKSSAGFSGPSRFEIAPFRSQPTNRPSVSSSRPAHYANVIQPLENRVSDTTTPSVVDSSPKPPRTVRTDRQEHMQPPKAPTSTNVPSIQSEMDTASLGEPMDISRGNERRATASAQSVKTPKELFVSSADLNKIFWERFGITFKMLASIGKPKPGSGGCFYIWAPKGNQAVEEEYELLHRFLKLNNAAIYSNRIEEDWERFLHVQNGVILLHESLMDQFCEPWFREIPRGQSWTFSLSKVVVDAPFQRLFPYGGAILITEDFIFYRPEGTLVFLTYFFYEYYQVKFPGSWKIMFRPGVLNWLKTLAEKDDKREIWIAIYCAILRLHNSVCDELPDTIIDDPLSESAVICPRQIPLYDSKSEDEAPGIRQGQAQEAKNADILVEFFAGWALLNCHRFRRFVVLTNLAPLPRWNSWYHLETILQGDKHALAHFKVNHKLYWNRLRGYPNSEDSEQTPTHTPFEPRTPNAPSNLDGASSADSRRRPSGRNHPQPYR